MQTLTRRGVEDAVAGLGLHFLHMSEGPFSHDAGHILRQMFATLIVPAIQYFVLELVFRPELYIQNYHRSYFHNRAKLAT